MSGEVPLGPANSCGLASRGRGRGAAAGRAGGRLPADRGACPARRGPGAGRRGAPPGPGVCAHSCAGSGARGIPGDRELGEPGCQAGDLPLKRRRTAWPGAPRARGALLSSLELSQSARDTGCGVGGGPRPPRARSSENCPGEVRPGPWFHVGSRAVCPRTSLSIFLTPALPQSLRSANPASSESAGSQAAGGARPGRSIRPLKVRRAVRASPVGQRRVSNKGRRGQLMLIERR